MNEDTQKRIGTILDETAERDAIHIAVVPLIAQHYLSPGDDVALAYGTTNMAIRKPRHYDGEPVGVVDPFLKDGVEEGERFYCFLFPGTVTGMRHHWQHPAFDNPPPMPKSESEWWLRTFADKWNFNYDEMISNAQTLDGYVVADGVDLHSAEELDKGDEALFWSHMEHLTGKRFDGDHRQRFVWSCSC